MRALLACLALTFAILLKPFAALPAAPEQRRLALVIGNADYRLAGSLANPVRDAQAMASMLRELGFDVIEGTDLDRAGMQSAIGEFAERLHGTDIALFYYAGHGIQVDGENLLIPTDADIVTETDLALATVPLEIIQRQMADAPRIKLVVLDACRDNPFRDRLRKGRGATRSLSTPDGLAPVSLRGDVGGTLIAFATDPGAYALDGKGQRHSPFTQALLRHMPKPGLELHEMMIDVRAEVWAATDQTQRPWSNSSLTGKVYLASNPEKVVAETSPSPHPPGTVETSQTAELAEVALWRAAERETSAAAYHAYLDAFPRGVFAGLAELRLGALLDPADPVELAVTKPSDTQPIPRPRPDHVPGESTELTLALAYPEKTTVQRNLQRLGFRPGRVDGIFGPRTRAAIRSWQNSTGLSATGFLDRPQLSRMAREASSARVASLSAPSRPVRTTTRRGRPVDPGPETGLLDRALHEIELNLQASVNGPRPNPKVERLLKQQRTDAHQR